MAKYVAAGSPIALTLDFKVNGELVVPTSATATITNNAGTIIGAWDEDELTLVDSATNVTLAISDTDNAQTLAYEVRYILVTFVYEGVSYTTTTFYTLRENINFPLTPGDVLSVIGMSDGDVGDEYIDIFTAYGLVQDDIPDVNIDNILSGGTVLLPTLIAAVKYKAASLLLIGSQNSLMQMEQSDNTLYRRFMEIDFNSIQSQIMAQYRIAIRKLQGVSTPTDQTYSLFVTGTDAVTGE